MSDPVPITPPLFLPQGLLCPACYYDLSGSPRPLCPECGRAVEPADLRGLAFRLQADRIVPRLFIAELAIGGVVVLAIAGVLALLGKIELAVGAAVLLSIAVEGPILLGWLAALLAPAPFRNAWRAAWLRAHPWYHTGWLLTPVYTLVLACLFWLLKPADQTSRELVIVLMIMAEFLAWLATTTLGFARAERLYSRFRQLIGVRHRAASAAYATLEVAMILGTLGLGLLGGVIGLVFVAQAAQ